jgi:hypothetical protein
VVSTAMAAVLSQRGYRAPGMKASHRTIRSEILTMIIHREDSFLKACRFPGGCA